MSNQVVILGAGRPHRGHVPSALRTDRVGTPTLEWLLDALEVDIQDVVFVGGYGVDQVRARYPALKVVVPEAWDRTGAVWSLLSAPLGSDAGAMVVYSDILVRPTLVDQIRRGSADVEVAWDSRWRERFSGRRRAVLEGREKVVMGAHGLERAGRSIPLEDASGEFLGLIRLSQTAVAAALQARTGRLPGIDVQRANLSELIDVLRLSGLRVDGADAAGDWAEIDEPRDIARFVLGTKADTLARLGRLVTASQVAAQVTRTVSQWERDASGSERAVEERFGTKPLIVRSSSTHEDAFSESNAGSFTSVLGVRIDNGLREAVVRVADSYRKAGVDAEVQQVLVQPMVDDVVLSGVVLTRTLDHGAPWTVIEYSVDGDTESVTSGGSGDLRTLFVRRAAGVRDSEHPEVDRVLPVLDAVAEVEDLLGHDALDIEFALDRGGAVHLLQVRPAVIATLAPRRDEAFEAAIEEAHRRWAELSVPPEHIPGHARLMLGIMPDWNPAEILGTAPGRLASDLYRRLVMDEIWARQRAEVGYRDVRPSQLLIDLAGRPYVDVRASFSSFLPATLDDALAGRLLEAALERLVARPELHDKVEFSVIPTCIDPDWDRWQHLLLNEGFVGQEIGALRRGLTDITARILGRVDRDLAAVNRLTGSTKRRLAGVTDPLVRAVILLEEATVLGTLPFAHLARAAFVAVSLLRGGQAKGLLSAAAVSGFHAGIHTVSQDLTVDAKEVSRGAVTWNEFIARWGHLRPGTYEITSLRYDADPERFLRPLVHRVDEPSGLMAERAETGAWVDERDGFLASLASLGIGAAAETFERTLRRAVEGREFAKLAFTRNLSDALESIAAGWSARGVDRDVLADTPLDLLLPGRNGRTADTGLVRDRAEEGRTRRVLAEALPLANLLTSPGDLNVWLRTADAPNFVGTRAVTAPTVELAYRGGSSDELSGHVVLVTRADPGYDWIFGHGLAGLITMFGGANSHMAIRAAEHGLPAAIGVGEQRYGELRSAREIELDPRGRTIRVLR